MQRFPGTIRTLQPRIHCITNYVTAGDCANLLLACGASPIMADDPEEAAEITSLSKALVLNLGTLSQQRIHAMCRAGRAANTLGLPVILDPVGVGASQFRWNAAKHILDTVHTSVIRCNVSELLALTGSQTAAGVDADPSDHLSLGRAQELAEKTGSVVAVTGEEDVIVWQNGGCIVRSGHAMMRSVTGAGCMLSALAGAYCAASPDALPDAVCAAVAAMGVCGELAQHRMTPEDGSASFRNYLIDAIFRLDGQTLISLAKYHML